MMISPPDVKRWKRGTLVSLATLYCQESVEDKLAIRESGCSCLQVLPTSAAPPSDVILLHFRHAEVWHARYARLYSTAFLGVQGRLIESTA